MHVFSAHNLCRLYVAAILTTLRALRHDALLTSCMHRIETSLCESYHDASCSMLRHPSWLSDHDESLRSSAQDSRSSRFYDHGFAAAGLVDDTRIWNPADPMCVAHTSSTGTLSQTSPTHRTSDGSLRVTLHRSPWF